MKNKSHLILIMLGFNLLLKFYYTEVYSAPLQQAKETKEFWSYTISPVIRAYYNGKKLEYNSFPDYPDCAVSGYSDNNNGGAVVGIGEGPYSGIEGYTLSNDKSWCGVYGAAFAGPSVCGDNDLGDGVFGRTQGPGVAGVYGETTNAFGFGIFARNTKGGCAIYADGGVSVVGNIMAKNLKNLAKDATVIGSSFDVSGIADGIVNRDIGYWLSDASAPWWVQLFWSKEQDINEIHIYGIPGHYGDIRKISLSILHDSSPSDQITDIDMPDYEFSPIIIPLTEKEGSGVTGILIDVTEFKNNTPTKVGFSEIECYYNPDRRAITICDVFMEVTN